MSADSSSSSDNDDDGSDSQNQEGLFDIEGWEKDVKKGWGHSNAKAALYACVVDGTIPLDAESDEDEEDLLGYFHSRPEIANYGGFKKHFKRRLNGVRDQVKVGKSRAAEDLEAFCIFRKNNAISEMTAHGYPQWDGSDAQKALEKDMLAFKHLEMEPSDLQDSNPVYDLFPLKVFREHIYQVTRTKKYLKQLENSTKMQGEKWKEFRRVELAEFESEDEED